MDLVVVDDIGFRKRIGRLVNRTLTRGTLTCDQFRVKFREFTISGFATQDSVGWSRRDLEVQQSGKFDPAESEECCERNITGRLPLNTKLTPAKAAIEISRPVLL